METLTLSEAAKRCGVSRKAIARKVERGALRSVLVDGKRRVSLSELERGGYQPQSGAVGDGEPHGEPHDPTGAIAPLLARLERLAAENARYRLLTEQAESLRVQTERELVEARARKRCEIKAPNACARSAFLGAGKAADYAPPKIS